MLTTRIYRAARSVDEALAEVKAKAGSQFCPRCVGALTRILPLESVVSELPSSERQLVRAS
jgi:HD-GYP domain-containing protein (c-di-GMP phosphodiesterase class II)